MSIFPTNFWFEKSNTNPEDDVFKSVDHILNSSYGTSRLDDFSIYARLYGKYQFLSFGDKYANQPTSGALTYNVVKSCVDTLTSKITQQTPSVMFLTDGENFFKQEKAKLATKYVAACMYVTNFESEAQKSFLHGSLFGLGALKIVGDKDVNQLLVESTFPFELFFDEYDSMYGRPRNLFQRKAINKDSLKALYPKFSREIDSAKNAGDSIYQRLYEQTYVIEAWHLPSGPDAKDGKHIICINNATLFEEKWDKPYFPFVFFHFTNPLIGFWPTGLGEMLMGLQLEINKTIKVIRRIMEYSIPKLVIPAGCSIASQQLSNYVMDIIKVIGGGKPEVMQLASANPQLFQYLAQLYQKAFEIAGISELSSQSRKPAGLNSGRAIRNFYQIESERYAVTEKKWEKMFIDGARMLIAESKELKDFKVTNISKDGITNISWEDIDLSDEDYKIQAFPISSLPKTPSGRLETVTDLIQGGYVTKEQGLELLNFPDVTSANDKDLAPRKLIRKYVDAIVLKNDLILPDKFDDLAYGVEYGQKSLALAKLNKLPEDRLNNLVRFITECGVLMDQINNPIDQQPIAEEPGVVPEVPMEEMPALGKPASPEVTDLLPIQGAAPVPGMIPEQ